MKWEYKWAEQYTTILNELGMEDWEAVAFDPREKNASVLMKRPIVQEAVTPVDVTKRLHGAATRVYRSLANHKTITDELIEELGQALEAFQGGYS